MWSKPFLFAMVGLILGLSLTLLVRTQDLHIRAQTHSRTTVDHAVTQLIDLNLEIEQLRAEISRFELIENEFRLASEVQSHLATAGHLPVRGPGIILLLKERHENISSHIAVEDIILILNELRAGGAEAMAVNGIRVTPNLQVRRVAGQGLTINGYPTNGVVRIEAIGDPDLLKSTITMRGGPYPRVEFWLDTHLQAAEELLVPAIVRPR